MTTALDHAIKRKSKPQSLITGNGPEFRSNHFEALAYVRGIRLDFIRPGGPVENAFIESFNGSLRDECLNAEWFAHLREAARAIEAGGSTAMKCDPTPRTDTFLRARYLAGGSAGSAGHLAI